MKPLRIAQISDLHFTEITYNPLSLCSKRIFGNLNWLFSRKKDLSREPLLALPPLLRSLELDTICLAGDFTTTALPREFDCAAAWARSLSSPFIAVPGNHDCYTRRAYRQRRFYRYFPSSDVHRLSPTWWLIALDTCLATRPWSAEGLFSEDHEKRLRETLAKIPVDHKILLLNHYPFFDNGKPRHKLERGKYLEQLLKEEPRIKAYLHGHTHRHTIADLQPSGLPVILDGGCSASTKAGSWNLLTLDEEGIAIDVYKWGGKWHVEKTERLRWTR